MYNYYQQQPSTVIQQPRMVAPTMPQFGGLKGHPVSSLEEVKATSIDFDGSIFYFPDIANKKIYTKTVGLDGIAQLNMYELKPLPTEPASGEFVTRQEFEQAMGKVAELLNQNKVTIPQQAPPAQESPQGFKEVF